MGVITKKMGGFIDKTGKFHSFGDTYEGYLAAEMRYGFDPGGKSAEFLKAYYEYTEQLHWK